MRSRFVLGKCSAATRIGGRSPEISGFPPPASVRHNGTALSCVEVGHPPTGSRHRPPTPMSTRSDTHAVSGLWLPQDHRLVPARRPRSIDACHCMARLIGSQARTAALYLLERATSVGRVRSPPPQTDFAEDRPRWWWSLAERVRLPVPRFNAWIVAAGVLAAIVWLSPEQFDPGQMRRTVESGAAQIRRNVSRVARLFREGLIPTGPEFSKPAAPERAARPIRNKSE